MAREKHLTAVHIGNFKRFVDFKVENLGQFNLVVGDNNTGKTSFLEALVMDEEYHGGHVISRLNTLLNVRKSNDEVSLTSGELVEVYKNRTSVDADLLIGLAYKEYYSFVNVSSHKLELSRVGEKIDKWYNEFKGNKRLKYGEVYFCDINDRESRILVSRSRGTNRIEVGIKSDDPLKLYHPSQYINFMPFGAGYDHDLEKVYDAEIEQSRVRLKEMIEQLKLFIPKVVDLRIRRGEITIYESDQDLGTPLYTYGEGAVKFFRILCYMAVAKGKRLMIDEIDTGIHHTKFVQFWKLLMQAATAYDVQLFATTHNEECLEYFQTALELEELEEQRDLARVVLLRENKDKSIFPQVHDYTGMVEAEEMGYEMRGRG